MAIEVAGKRFVTLADEFFVNGAKVYAAFANGVKVYPEEEPYSDLLEGYVEQPLHISDRSCEYEIAARNVGIGVTNYYLSEQFTGEFVGTTVWWPDSGAVAAILASNEPFTATRHFQSGKYDFDSGSKTITVDEYSDFQSAYEHTYNGKNVFYLWSNFQKSDWRTTDPNAATALVGLSNDLSWRVAWAMVYDLRKNNKLWTERRL